MVASAPSSWSSGCLHWPWLWASLVLLSLFSVEAVLHWFLFIYLFFLALRMDQRDFFLSFFLYLVERVRRIGYMPAKCHVGHGTGVLVRMWVSVRAWCQFFFFCLYSSCVRAYVTRCTLVVAVILSCSTSWRAFRSNRQSASFQSYWSSLLSGTHCHP